ncbi:MAG: FkbM family methyltransferase [Actinomycetota bacterium]|nr:FkbM family methyltransferase [Actinomycetota bacterium]
MDCLGEAVDGQRRCGGILFLGGHDASNANSIVRGPGAIAAIRVPTVLIDELTANAGCPVSCVKIDVEGAELDVLRGSRRTMETDRPALALDIHPAQLQAAGGSVAEIWELLESASYVPSTASGCLIATPSSRGARSSNCTRSRLIRIPTDLPSDTARKLVIDVQTAGPRESLSGGPVSAGTDAETRPPRTGTMRSQLARDVPPFLQMCSTMAPCMPSSPVARVSQVRSSPNRLCRTVTGRSQVLGAECHPGEAAVLRTLITGGAGFIGSHLADSFVRRGDRLVVLDDLSTGRLHNIRHLVASGQVELIEGTTSRYELVEKLVAQCDRCLHLASAVGVQLVVSNPLESLLRNVHGCDNVLNAAARHGKRVLFTSTSEVYGKNAEGGLAETSDRILGSPFMARWNYAIAKEFGESLAYGLHRDRGAEAIVVRLFNTVGPRQTGMYGMVLPRFVRQALAGDDVTVFGDGTQVRCFAHVADTIRGIQLLLDDDRAVGRVFNIGNTMPLTIMDLARRVIERSGSSSQIRMVSYDEAYDEGFEELGRRQPDTTAIRELTGWETERTVEDAIDDVIVYERARPTDDEDSSLAA